MFSTPRSALLTYRASRHPRRGSPDYPPGSAAVPPGPAAPRGPRPHPAYHAATEVFQRELLRRALAQAQGNQMVAAQVLGLQRTSFHRVRNPLGLR